VGKGPYVVGRDFGRRRWRNGSCSDSSASADTLAGLVGSRLDASELLAGVSAEFVEMFDDGFDGRTSLTNCAAEVLAGDLESTTLQ
jgi:hypothetical protein